MEHRNTDSLYASGLDCVQLRTLLRMGSLRGWRAASLDIRTAFLLTPTSQEELICIDPPRVMKELGILPWDCCWIVQGALYDLTTAPRDWMLYRNDTLREMKIEYQGATLRLRQLGDANMWGIFDEGVQDQRTSVDALPSMLTTFSIMEKKVWCSQLCAKFGFVGRLRLRSGFKKEPV